MIVHILFRQEAFESFELGFVGLKYEVVFDISVHVMDQILKTNMNFPFVWNPSSIVIKIYELIIRTMRLSAVLDSVSNNSLCNWFYYMFLLNCVVAVIMLVRVVYILSVAKAGLGLGSLTFLLTVLSMAIPIINGAAFYALCDRSLGKGSL